jgi:uncharacterized protein
MELSHYALIFSSDEPGYRILYSTLFGSVIQVDDETLERIRAGKLEPDEVEALREQGLLVEDVEAEKREAARVLEQKNAMNTLYDITAVMNLDCNLDCSYCYEGDLKGRHYMTSETADELVAFISGNLPEKTENINIDFYGGEPLMSRNLIKYISEKVGALAKDTGREYGFKLVTNGTLLTPAVAEELVSLGLKRVKITLDGPARVHDAQRPFKGGGGSFDAIVNNLVRVAGMLEVSIGGNFTRENYKDFPALLDVLTERGLGPDRVACVKFDPVVKGDNWNMPADFRDVGVTQTEDWIVDAFLSLREEILKRGYRTQSMDIFTCAIEVYNIVVVNYNGDIYKCPGMLGKEAFRVGTLTDGIKDYSRTYALDVWKTGECHECKYLPVCYGGCRYMTLLKDGKVERVDCRKDYFAVTLETMIKQDLRAAEADTKEQE